MWIESLLAVTLLSAFIVFLSPDRVAGRLAFVLSLLPLAISILMFSRFDGVGNAFLPGGTPAFETHVQWIDIEPYAISWWVGVDGISMPLVLLATILTTLAIVSAWTPIDERRSQFYGLVLFLEMSLIGVFVALDFIVWFVFWEGVLIPMYLLIGVWGGPRRKYAAIKFFVYTNLASLVMFVGFVALVFALGDAVGSFGLPEITEALLADELGGYGPLTADTLKLLGFIAVFAGLAVKVPVVPVHTWLPDAHVEAPTPVSVILAGVLLKMGTYALLRFNFTMLEDVARRLAPFIAAIAVISIIYGALLALAQSDLKRIVAYSSIASMGYVILGLIAYTTYGMGGATFQMISHGLISGLMFMVVGVIYNQTHTRMVSDMAGLADRMPIAAGVFVAGGFAYLGLPLMSGFVGEFTIFFGAFQSAVIPSAPLVTGIAMLGIVIVAGYLLWAMQRTLFGPFHLDADVELTRSPVQDIAPLFVLLALIIVLGVHPELAFDMIEDAVTPALEAAGGDV